MRLLCLLLFLFFLGCSSGDSSNSETSTDGDLNGSTTDGDLNGSTTDGDDVDSTPQLSCPTEAAEFHAINVGELTLNVACRGQGKTIVLLHGFPDFWYGWKKVMDELAGEYRLVVPDQRGYNLSDKPEGLASYKVEKLVADIAGLIASLGNEKVILVGHDWGGVVAWAFGATHPELLEKLIILNAPHPQVFARELEENPAQQQASGYITFFMDENAEAILSPNEFAALGGAIFNDSFSEEDRAAYIAAWGQPGALTAMLNWYRANFEDGKPPAGEVIVDKIPTLVLWGMKDTALLPGNLVGLEDYVTDLTVQKFENATHWIAQEEPSGVADAIRKFVESSD